MSKKEKLEIAWNIFMFLIAATVMICLFFQKWNNVQEAEKEMERQQREQERIQEEIRMHTEEDSGIINEATQKKQPKTTNLNLKAEPDYRYIKDCTLSKKVQRKIFNICSSEGISFEFVMSVIYQESGWNASCTSDDGESIGLMQIQGRWHTGLMKKLGCSDLKDPVQNVRVGVELLKRHFKTYKEPAWALMAYNGGQAYADRMIEAGRISGYATKILKRSARYEKENGL